MYYHEYLIVTRILMISILYEVLQPNNILH